MPTATKIHALGVSVDYKRMRYPRLVRLILNAYLQFNVNCSQDRKALLAELAEHRGFLHPFVSRRGETQTVAQSLGLAISQESINAIDFSLKLPIEGSDLWISFTGTDHVDDTLNHLELREIGLSGQTGDSMWNLVNLTAEAGDVITFVSNDFIQESTSESDRVLLQRLRNFTRHHRQPVLDGDAARRFWLFLGAVEYAWPWPV